MASMSEDEPYLTPSKQLESGLSSHPSPWKPAESPSSRLLRDIGLQTVEYHRELHSRLDQKALQAQKAHVEALAAAAAEHDRVRRAAERAQHRVEIEFVKERQQREAEESEELLREEKENVEREIARKRRQLEEVRQIEDRRRAAEEASRQAELEQTRRLQRQVEEEKAEKEAAEREERQKHEEAARLRESQAAAPAQASLIANIAPSVPSPEVAQQSGVQGSQSVAETTPGLVSSMAVRKSSHEQYVKLHQRLKEMRRFVMEQVKQDARTKSRVGDMRREIKKSMGQLTGEKGANRTQVSRRSFCDSWLGLIQTLDAEDPSIIARGFKDDAGDGGCTTIHHLITSKHRQCQSSNTWSLHLSS